VDIVDPDVHPDFSIRKAIWAVRLQPIIKQLCQPTSTEEEYELLANASEGYRFAELTSEIMGEKIFYSAPLDLSLAHGSIEGALEFGMTGLKNTKSICKSNCETCSYSPVVKGQLCEPKFLKQQRDRIEKRLEEGKELYSEEEGD